MKEGLFLRGTASRIVERTISPKEGGKQFQPFKLETLHVAMYDGEVVRRVDYGVGEVPEDVLAALETGGAIEVPVRVTGWYQGEPQFAGKVAAD